MLKVKEIFSPFHILLCSTTFSAKQHPVFSRNLFYPGTALLCSILSFLGIYSIQEPLCSISSRLFQESFYPGTDLLCSILSFPGYILSKNCCALQLFFFLGIYSIQELLCSAASRLFQESIQSRNCSALQHPVFSRNLFYPETALLYAASRLFQEYIPSRNCFALQHRLFSRNIFHSRTVAQLCSIPCFPGIYLSKNCSDLQHLVFSRNLFYTGTAMLCNILSFPGIFLSRNCSPLQHPLFSGIYSIQELLCSAASCPFQESILSRNCSALQHSVFFRNLFFSGTVLLCRIPSISGLYYIQELHCSAASFVFQKYIPITNCC